MTRTMTVAGTRFTRIRANEGAWPAAQGSSDRLDLWLTIRTCVRCGHDYYWQLPLTEDCPDAIIRRALTERWNARLERYGDVCPRCEAPLDNDATRD